MRTTVKSGVLHCERKRAFVKGFQRSFKSRTGMPAVVPGTAGNMDRVTLITACHVT